MKTPVLITCFALPVVMLADSIPTVNRRAEMMTDPMIGMARYGNPVVKQWMTDVSLSAVGVSFADEDRSLDIDPQKGEGETKWQAFADTYLKHRSSTLWGGAAYDNGVQRNVRYNETADIDILYPYVAADTIGGDIKLERYSFYGGYADSKNRLAWGACVGYKAGLYYRNVDPRPKNVTGLLDLSVGVGYTIWRDYNLLAAFDLRRYTQSNDITFRSEMGVEKIYHLTGLGNHYYRFAGQGLSAHYGGYRYGASADLFPASRNGLAISANVSRFTFDKVLTDINELPLVSAWHNAMSARASWLAHGLRHDWALSADFDAYRRHGSENIFGDPSSNIYPQIGSQEMYADNHYDFTFSGLYSYHTPTMRIWAKPAVGYSHRSQIYALPAAELIDNHRFVDIRLGVSALFGAWHAQAAVGYEHQQHFGNIVRPDVSVSRALGKAYSLSLRCRGDYSSPFKSINLAATLIF